MPKQPPRSAALIVNAKSRKGQDLFDSARVLLKQHGIKLTTCKALKRPERISGEIQKAVHAGVPLIIVGGGDGTISCSVDHLVGSDSVFALLPLGTANSFARTLGIPIDVEGAVDVIANGQEQAIDLAKIGDDYFANCASIGIAPLIAETVPHGLKKWLGRPGYLAWAAVQMTRFKPFALTVRAGRRKESLEALEVRIANGAYHGGTELIDTHPSSGEVVIQVVTGGWRTKLLWSWGLSLIGPDKARGTVREFRGDSFTLTTEPPLPISIDGEVLAHTPVEVRLARKAIRMMVPA
jgi:YegS/Rv2252/BmrU family lipid kinase